MSAFARAPGAPSEAAIEAAAKVLRQEFDSRSNVPPQARYIRWEAIREDTRQLWRDGVRNPLRAAYAVDGFAASADDRALRDENARLKSWVSDLQSGMYVNCVYCGHRYGPGETTPVSMADALKAHVEQCPQHPMSALKAEVVKLRAALAGAVPSMPSQ